MPSSIFSHQAPALALKVKFPKRFDGTALCFGTLIPDFNFILDFFFPINFYGFTHSLIGQIFWTIPLVILLTLIFSRFLGPYLAKIGSKNGKLFEPLRYFGVDEWEYLEKKRFNHRFWIIAVYSAFIGGLFHILLDWPSHAMMYLLHPWINWPNFDFLFYSLVDYGTVSLGFLTFEANLKLYNLLWIIETILALIISLYYLRYMKKHNLIRKWYSK
ncbi:MAG: DUF4184 family protein [Promethearchaeota archaeon]|jgi:membrane-bound metal-dependent hydrolase YbcI (DUF457 family)